MMALTKSEDCTTEGLYPYLSSCIIDEVLKNIANSLLPSSSINPVEFDAAESATGKLVQGCCRGDMTDAEKMADDAQEMPAVKRVTFSDEVTMVSYEAASQGENEETDSQCRVMEDDKDKESVRITTEEDGVGIDGGDFTEKMLCCSADGNILKRKSSGGDLENKCIIPNKMIRPEADSVVSDHNQQAVNEENVGAIGSQFLNDASEEKLDSEKADVGAILKVAKCPNICMEVTQGEEEHRGVERAEGISVCSPWNMDCTVQDTCNPTVYSLYQNDAGETAVSNGALAKESPRVDVIDDCRSVLQSIVDNTLLQMGLNTKLDKDTGSTPDTDEQPLLKKFKPEPPSDPGTPRSFLSNSTGPVSQMNMKMLSYPKDIPNLSNTSTADVEQLAVSETINVITCTREAVISCDKLNTDLSLDTEGKSFHKVPQMASESASVSTSTEDGMEDLDGDDPMVNEAMVSCAELSPDLSLGREIANGHMDLQVTFESTGVSTSTRDAMEEKDVHEDSPMIKDAGISCPDLSSGREIANGHMDLQVASDSAGVSSSNEDAKEDKDVNGDGPMIKEPVFSCAVLSPDLSLERESVNGHMDLQVACDSTDRSTSTEDVMEDKYVDGDSPIIKNAGVSFAEPGPDLSARETTNGCGNVPVTYDSADVSIRTPDGKEDEDEDKTMVMEDEDTSPSPCIPSPTSKNEYMTSNNLHRQDAPCLSTPDVYLVKDLQNTTHGREKTKAMEATETLPPPCIPSTIRENEYISSNKSLDKQHAACKTTPDVEVVEDIQNLILGEEPNAYSSILAQDLYLGDSVEYPAHSGTHDNVEKYIGDTLVPSSADVEVVKPDDAYVDVIEPSLREDIMPSPGSSGDDFSCTFQKASQVLTNSQSDSHPLPKLDSTDLEITTADLHVPTFDLGEPVREEVMNNPIGCDWEAKLTDNSATKALEFSVQDHRDIVQEPMNIHLTSESKAKPTLPEIPEHQFLQVLGLSPEQPRVKSPDQRKTCQSGHNDALLTHVLDSSSRGIEAIEENHSMLKNLGRPVEDSEAETSKPCRIEAKGANDQTVPSLQTSFKGDPCIDHLLELEESIFSEQDIKCQEEPMKQGILVSEAEPFIEESKPVPDHLQTLGQHAAGVFQWNHSPALTPCPTNADQSTLQCIANHLDQTPPITPVRPLPACQRRRRVGLSRRQLVFPLHSKTFSRK